MLTYPLSYLMIYFNISEVKATPHIQPTTEQVVRLQDSSSSDTDYSLNLTAEEVLAVAQ